MYTIKYEEYEVQESDCEVQNVALLIWKVFYMHFAQLSMTSLGRNLYKSMICRIIFSFYFMLLNIFLFILSKSNFLIAHLS